MRFVILFLISVCLVGCSATQNPRTYDNVYVRIERVEKSIAESNDDINDIKNSLDIMEQKLDQISTLEQNLGRTTSQVSKGSIDNADLEGVSIDEGAIRVPVSEKEVQIALKNAGYYEGAIDGKIGAQSITAIKAFQADFDLIVDGVVGRQTWGEMKKYLK